MRSISFSKTSSGKFHSWTYKCGMTIHQPRILPTYYFNERNNKAERSLSKTGGLSSELTVPSSRQSPPLFHMIIGTSTRSIAWSAQIRHSTRARSRLLGALDSRNLYHHRARAPALRGPPRPGGTRHLWIMFIDRKFIHAKCGAGKFARTRYQDAGDLSSFRASRGSLHCICTSIARCDSGTIPIVGYRSSIGVTTSGG